MYHKSLILQGRPHDWNVFSECVYVYVYMCTWTGSASVYQLVLIWFLTVRIKNILGKTWLWEFFFINIKDLFTYLLFFLAFCHLLPWKYSNCANDRTFIYCFSADCLSNLHFCHQLCGEAYHFFFPLVFQLMNRLLALIVIRVAEAK